MSGLEASGYLAALGLAYSVLAVLAPAPLGGLRRWLLGAGVLMATPMVGRLLGVAVFGR